MKTTQTPPASPRRASKWSAVAAILGLSLNVATAASVITSVVETGGDNEATDTITAKWTGITFPVTVANEPVPGAVIGNNYTVGTFADWAPTFVDRNHRYTNAGPVSMPGYLVGRDYIMSGNDNRDNATYLLDVTVASQARVYMLIDNRLSDGDGNNPPTFGPANMQWMLDEGWMPVMTGVNRTSDPNLPDEIGIDESADGSINQWYSIYSKLYPAGTFQLKQADNAGRNMYGVVVAAAVPPPAPILTAVGGDSKVTLNWTVSSGAASYTVFRSFASGGPYDVLGTTATTSYLDESVVNGSTYYYVVSATNQEGESDRSNEAEGKPFLAPTGVTATGGNGQVQVQWSALAGASSYSVRRSLVSGGPYETIATGINGTTHTDSDVLSGRVYYYVVAASLTAGGESGQSEEASALTGPSAPINLVASLYAATIFQVSWSTEDPVVDSFVIEESTDNSLFVEIASVAGNVRRHIISGILPEETRYYRVKAANATGDSAVSATAQVTAPTMGWNINFANAINGTPANDLAPTPEGYLQDIGEIFGLRPDGSFYGWDRDITVDSRWRKAVNSPDLRYDTFNHLQKATPSAIWELEIPDGFYSVHIASGDATAVDSVFQFDLEGVITQAKTPSGGNNWQEFTQTVIINDGMLTVNSGPLAANNKIAFIDVYPAIAAPIVIGTQPQSKTVEENRPLTVTVSLSAGSSPFTYRWLKDGVEVPDSTTYTADSTGTLTIPEPTVADSGSYTVEIVNYAGSVTSDAATVTVVPDTTGPRVVRVSANLTNLNQVIVEFDEKIPNDVATLPFNYTLGIEGASAAEQSEDGLKVYVTFNTPLVLNETYEFSLNTITDLAGNPIDPDPTVITFVAGAVEKPELTIERVGGNVSVSWSASAPGFVLYQADTLASPENTTAWSVVSAAPTVVGGRNVVTVPATGAQFFRLRK